MMFLHSGASLHGHEYNRPSPTNPHSQQQQQQQQRRRPFLRSALPAPILCSASASVSEVQPSAQTLKTRSRPVSEVHYRPISDLYPDESPHTKRQQHPAPVVRFKDLDAAESSPASPMTEEDPSLYDSDASQTTTSTLRHRRRKSTVRSSTNFLLAVPPPRTNTKALLKAARPRLLLQLQELPSNQRPLPSIDVFPASVIAGCVATACQVNRLSRLFGIKGEVGPRDLVLVRSEDYTNGEDEETNSGRRQPIAVFRRGRNQGEKEEIVLDDGTVWTCTTEKGYHSFVHVDEHGRSRTARWVKRSAAKRVASISSARTSSSANSTPGIPPSTADSADPDCRYTFSLINPLSRRHPILASLTPQSLEIFDSYTTPSASQGRYPPTRPISCVMDSGSSVGSQSPCSPLFEEAFTKRETHVVDESIKKLITITSLWLTLRIGPSGPIAPSTDCASDAGTSDHSALCSQDSAVSVPSGLSMTRTVPRRQTTSNAVASAPSSQAPAGLRRAMSTGASFMQRRRQKQLQLQQQLQQHQSLDTTNDTNMELEKVLEAEPGKVVPDVDVTETLGAQNTTTKQQNPRLSWFRKLTH